MNTTSIFLLVAGALALNYASRRLIKWMDSRPVPPVDYRFPVAQLAEINSTEILAVWGQPLHADDASLAGPIHRDIAAVLEKFSAVMPNQDAPYLDRALALQPYADNPEFVRIGRWDEDDDVLARRSADDPAIYVSPTHDEPLGSAFLFVESIDCYLRAAWALEQEILKN